MKKILSVLAALLLITLITIASLVIEVNVAVAAERPEHFKKNASVDDAKKILKQKKAEKILFMIESLGISDPDISALVYEIDNRTKDGYFMLHQKRVAGGTLSLRYALEPKISTRKVELLYAPDNSHTEYSVRTNSVMINYKLKF